MEDILRNLEFEPITPSAVIFNLAMALVLSLLTAWTYRVTHGSMTYNRSFGVTMISVTMTITLIMMIIGDYLALSLGLVGALSVIRFRSAIKDPRDIAFLFLCIAIGLACSTGNYVTSILGAVIINGTIFALHRAGFGSRMMGDYCLTFVAKPGETSAADIEKAAVGRGIRLRFRSYADISDDEGEYVYGIDLGELEPDVALNFFRREVTGLSNVSLLSPEARVEL